MLPFSRSLTLALLTTACLVAPGRALTLFSDNFDNVPNGNDIHGRTPPEAAVGGSWVATTSTFLGNGAQGLAADVSLTASASLDLGAGYLAAYSGVYEFTLDITQPVVAGPSSSWVGFGFAETNTVSTNLVGNTGEPWIIYRINDGVTVFAGPSVANGFSTSAATGSTHTFKLQLDTAPTLWTLNAFLDGNPIDLNGAASGATFTYTTNPTTARYVQLAVNNNVGTGTNGIATVDNLLVTGPIPEPAAATLALLGTTGLMILRRRR